LIYPFFWSIKHVENKGKIVRKTDPEEAITNLIILLNFFNIFTTLETCFALVIPLFFRKKFKSFPSLKTFSTTFQQQMLSVF